MQIAYLTNRPKLLHTTLESVERHMPWVTSIAVSTPASVDVGSFELPATVVTDEDVTGLGTDELQSMDHSSRNFTLRRALVEQKVVDATFILSDDDFRPLTDVPLSDYIDADGAHQPYWFYELEKWPGRETPYDLCQIRTLSILRLLGTTTLAFGAHMPQIVRREWFAEAAQAADDVGGGRLIDEWSLYFNVAMTRHPDGFADAAPFRTLAWPQWPHQWPHQIAPHPIRFENHYPSHEQPGGLFYGLPAVDQVGGALARVEAWRKAELAIGELDFDPSWDDPWIRNNPLRRSTATAMRAAQKLRKHTNP